MHYGDLIKSLRKNASLSNDVYECNRVANSAELPNSLLRFSLEGNQVQIDGFHEGYTITNVGNNSFSPAEHKMIAHYKFIRNDGSYAIVEEEYLLPNTNIPLPIEKQPPVNVFDATGLTVKNLFTFYQDLVVIEPYVGGGGCVFTCSIKRRTSFQATEEHSGEAGIFSNGPSATRMLFLPAYTMGTSYGIAGIKTPGMLSLIWVFSVVDSISLIK